MSQEEPARSRDWVSLREFARRCARRHRAAQRAIEDGRIPASAVRHDERGRIIAIEYYQAAACWRANSAIAWGRPDIPAPRPAAAAAAIAPLKVPHDTITEQVGLVLGLAFANALIPACAIVMYRYPDLDADRVLNHLEDLLLAAQFSAADVLQLDPLDDRPAALFTKDLADTLRPESRRELLERIRAVALQYADDERAARAAGDESPLERRQG